jgi:hypothetical protein
MIVCDIWHSDTPTRRRVDPGNAANDQTVGHLPEGWTSGRASWGRPVIGQVAVPSSSTSATMTAAASALSAWRAMFW